MAEEEISFNRKDFDEGLRKTKNFFMNRKFQAIIVGILLLGVIFIASDMRTQNMDRLEDSTTGKKIPLALDPFYWLRISETKLENNGELPEVDEMRSPVVMDRPFKKEIMPDAVIGIWKAGQIFDSDFTLRHANVLSPVIFFALGITAFFFLIYGLTRNRWTALASSTVLAFVPSYLYRTMAGFSDHESIGMFAFFLLLAGFSYSIKFLYKKGEKLDWKKASILGLLIGILASFTIVSWEGVAKIALIILSFGFFIFWITQTQYRGDQSSSKKGLLSFYISWFIFLILGGLLFGFSPQEILEGFILTGQGAIVPFVLGFVIVDFIAMKILNKQNSEEGNIDMIKRYRPLFSFGFVLAIGFIALALTDRFGELLGKIIDRLIRPMGSGRIGQTVAENRAPFLGDWVSQFGQMFFWAFLAGLLFVGHRISKGIEEKKYRGKFMGLWILLLAGIILSRISQDSLLNGTNTFSVAFYVISLVAFFAGTFYIYANSKFNIKPELVVIFAWMLFMLIATRGSVRLLFVVTPFMAFMGVYAIQNCIEYWRKSKDSLAKILFIAGVVLFAILIALSFSNYVSATDQQAQNTGPSADGQWQEAMEWVRTTTPEDSIFGHWWDYGYWVQYLGERATIMDGGNRPNGLAHLFGRYALTTKRPETALSLMKTHNVSHLLIDSSDLGKYGAYSSIGSGPDRGDRRSQIPTMRMVPQQTRETQNSTTRVYQGGTAVDKDIAYETSEGDQIFLPKNRAGIGGVEIKTNETGNGTEIQQPEGIFVYQGERFRVPLKNAYYDGEIYEFERGINATAVIMPSVSRQGRGISINEFGSVIYLSPKTSGTMFAELYLMGDPRNNYPSIELAHKQDDPLVRSLRRQGADVGDFLVRGGFRGPIKIWNVTYPDHIVKNEKLLKEPDPYGSYDNIKFSESK